MKKTTDKDGQIFDNDYFSGKGGNVVSLTSEYAFGHETELSDEDKLIHMFMEECNEGVENCTGLCSGCDLKSQCSYTKQGRSRREAQGHVCGDHKGYG